MNTKRPCQTETFLQELVSIETCDPPGNEIEAANLIASRLDEFGIEVEIDEFLPGRANVLGRLRGQDRKPPLVYSAHIDTVPIGNQTWSVGAFSGEIRDGRLYGRGASDMKSGLVAMAIAARDLAERGVPLAGDLILAFSAGESSNCLGAKRFVERGLLAQAGALLVSEPSSLQLVTAEMGVLWLRAVSHGKIGHVSGNGGANAIDGMLGFLGKIGAHVLPEMDHAILPEQSLSVGRIRGGSAVNVTPDLCEAEIDIRLRPNVDIDTVVNGLRALAPATIDIEVTDFKPAVETAASDPFAMLCAQILEPHTGQAPKALGVSYYSDATILSTAHGTPFTIIGPGDLGMSGEADESVSLDALHKSVQIYSDIAERWLS